MALTHVQLPCISTAASCRLAECLDVRYWHDAIQIWKQQRQKRPGELVGSACGTLTHLREHAGNLNLEGQHIHAEQLSRFYAYMQHP